MTDINKQIEEESREFAFKSCPYHNSDCKIEHCNSNCQWHRYSQKDDSYKKFKQGAQWMQRKLENSFRWRKFGVDDLPKIGRQIICRDGDKYHLSKPISHDGIHWLAEHFIEWKPID